MGLSYKDAGVDIDAGEEVVARIKKNVESTFGPEVMTGIGSFGAAFAPELKGYRNPVFVSGTDGVGTKLKVAFMMDKHDTVGIDLVAMCVNDILAQGARPLFFLDYLASGKIEADKIAEVVKGITDGCRQAGCALIGGETAEMPDFYDQGEYDMAGFTVGLVDKDKIITGEEIKPGDRIIGLPSNGIHSNGYSLVRKIFFELKNYSIDAEIDELDNPLGEELLKPTRIYVKKVLAVLDKYSIKGIAHITGGGMTENIPRILPEGTGALIEKGSWPIQPIFKLIKELGNVREEEMYRTFNMGIGMVLVVPQDEVDSIIKETDGFLIGDIKQTDGNNKVEYRG